MKRLLLFFLLLTVFSSVKAKTEQFGTWVELTFTKKFLKDFEFSFIPEFRFQDEFKLDEYILEGKLGYEPFKFLDLGASYRYNTNIRDKGNVVSHGIVFDITGKTDYKRFDGSLRTRFTNDLDADDILILQLDNWFFRPRAKIKYNIKGVKIDPYVSYEVFYDFKLNEWFKGRFDIGASRDLGKLHEIGLYYRYQDYYYNRSSVSILGINYELKF
jgi:hypothetical protein